MWTIWKCLTYLQNKVKERENQSVECQGGYKCHFCRKPNEIMKRNIFSLWRNMFPCRRCTEDVTKQYIDLWINELPPYPHCLHDDYDGACGYVIDLFIIFRFDLLLCLGFCFFYKYVFVCCVVVFMHYFVFFQYVFLCFVMFATTPVFYKSMLGCYPCSSLVIFLTTMYRLASYWKHTADGLSLFTPTQTGWNSTGWDPT